MKLYIIQENGSDESAEKLFKAYAKILDSILAEQASQKKESKCPRPDKDIIKEERACACEAPTDPAVQPEAPLPTSLLETIPGMVSPDYNQRLIAERDQLAIRLFKLRSMIDKYKNNKLDFEPTCPLILLEKQAASMSNYLRILNHRIKLEIK